MKTTLKATLVATAIATLPITGFAAGLGAINVLSGLGQPLRAEIELQATPQELQSLSARVASAEAFRQTGVNFSPLMTGLQFSVETRGSRSLVRVSSDRPVNEPFMEMLIELNWAGGRLLREYTFLLDPVDLARPPIAAAPVSQARPSAPAPVAAPVAAPVRPTVSAPAAPSGEYRVRRGDTLRGIANAQRPANVSLDQMLVALVRQNPQAFDDGNMNRLKAGAILRIPDQAMATAIAPAEARREIVAQAADFEAYRNRLSGAVAARPAPPPPTETRESSGEITPRVEAPVVAEVPQDRVEVTGAPSDGAGDSRLARLQALEEELVTREKSLEEANLRLADLERSIRDLQRLIELRNESLAQLQQQLIASGALPAEPLPADLLPLPVEVTPGDDSVSEAPADTPADAVVPMDEAAVPATPPAPVVEAPAPTTQVAPAPPPAPAPAPAPAVETIPERDPFAPQPSFVQSLMQDPMLLAGGGGVLALLLLYAAYKVRSRRKAQEEQAIAAEADYPSEGNSVFGEKGGQTVDTGSSSVLHTDFSQSGLSSIDADEGVDPVAEADVYMAYGRDAQAEEILLDALKVDASREALYVKLLEIYAQRPSPRQFESIATEFYSKTGGVGENWSKAAEMGSKLEPENPLYKSSSKSVSGEAPETEPGRDRPSGGVQAAAAAGLAAAGAGALTTSEADKTDIAEVAGDDNQLSEIDFTTSARVQADSDRFDAILGDQASASGDSIASETERVTPGHDTAVTDESPDELSMLDFDLGSDDAVEETGATVPVLPGSETVPQDDEEVEAVSVPDDTESLHFDLDVDEPADDKLKASDPESELEQIESDALEVDSDAGFAEIELPELESTDIRQSFDPDSMNATVVGNVNDLDFELGEFDRPISEGSSEDPATDRDAAAPESNLTALDEDFLRQDVVEESAIDLEKTEFDNDLLDFDFDLGQESEPRSEAKVKSEPPSLDLTSINLDLDLDLEGDDIEQDLGQADRTASESLELEGTTIADPPPEIVQEVETKLDLARAYEEMGDKEGARELIDEVLREGSASQREMAARLLDRLG